MSKNPGNTGHHGYKMSKVVAIDAVDDKIAIVLECGHVNWCYPHSGYTALEWVGRLQQGPGAFVIGKTRLRCHQSHEQG